jgi:effector-binding domain-containing protein
MFSPCEIVDQPEQPVLSVRIHTSVEQLPAELGKAYGAIMQYLGEQGEYPSGAPFAAYYNMDMQALDVEAGFPIPHPLPGKDTIQSWVVPARKVATCQYTGPYADCVPAYEALTAFVAGSGHEPTGVAIEYYLNGPETPPEDLQTQIAFPLKVVEPVG